MADKYYLIKKSENTPAIRAKAEVLQEYEFMKVRSANVASVDTSLALINADYWFSGDTADSGYERGYQADGITLPKKAVDG